MAKKRKIPHSISLFGETYKLAVLRVQTRYEDGSPEDVTFIKDDMTVELSSDVSQNEFIVGFMPVRSLEKE